ncbi:MAG: S-layer homology domain-containing protein [Oscillospiraceae bacterium]|jgi:uncharacterized repeat protein (TIGR02543 family)|nr:S-layer homology domain-containing protein [Oscillospiraceae bacterium]
MKRKRILSTILSVALLFSFSSAFSLSAAAADGVAYLAEGGATQYQDGVTVLASPGDISGSTLTDGWYLVRGSFTFNAMLTISGDVHLILEDGCDFTVNGPDYSWEDSAYWYYAAIFVNGTNSLTIYSQSTGAGMGKLTATGGDGGTGIGGRGYDGADNAVNQPLANAGIITIHGGSITARGGYSAAGIGGGFPGGSGGVITITGGEVTAYGSLNNSSGGGAGIGGGGANVSPYPGGASGIITISGNAIVNAYGGYGNYGGAGIGSGSSTNGIPGAVDAIIIENPANVTATGGTGQWSGIGGAAIGGAGGSGGTGTEVTPLIMEARPAAVIDYEEETLTGLTADAVYDLGSADANGKIAIDASWFGTTVSLVKTARDALYADSAAQSIAIPARPAAPNAAGTPETVSGLSDGKITGLTAGVDYEIKLSSEADTLYQTATADPQGEIIGLSPETYSVRLKAVAGTSFSGEAAVIAIGSGTQLYTVTFDANGGSAVSSQSIAANAQAVQPTYPTKDGFKFAGWYTDAALTQAYDFTTAVTSSFTLYAKWTPGAQFPFTDVTTADWFYDNVFYVWKNGMISGTSATTFSPNDPMTRAMLVTVLWRQSNSPAASGGSVFTDVPDDAYYAAALTWAAQNNIVHGIGDGLFSPNTPIKREELTAILYRYAKEYLAVDVTQNVGTLTFADTDEISGYALDAAKWCFGNGIISGKPGNIFDPQGSATRAEIVTMIHKFIVNV